jgi:tetratricopeptide (TPR) repeat protein
VAGVLATHYIDAYEAAPDGPEGAAVAAQARIALRAAADRATALGAHESAIGYWDRARGVTSDPAEEADLLEKIGVANRNLGHQTASEAAFRDALERYRALGDRVGAARASFGLGRALAHANRLGDAMTIAEGAAAEIADLAPHRVLVELWLALSAGYLQMGQLERTLELADRALADAERLRLFDLVIEGMQGKGGAYWLMGRTIEGRALIEAALTLAERAGNGPLTARSAFHLSLALIEEDPRASVEAGRRTIELSRRYGIGPLRLTTLMNTVEAALAVGDWAWLEADLDAINRDELEPSDQATLDTARIEIGAIRGRDVAAAVEAVRTYAATSQDPQIAAGAGIGIGLAALAEGRFEDAIHDVQAAERDDLNGPFARFLSGRAALRLGDRDRAAAALERLDASGWRGTAIGLNRDALAAGVAALDGRWADAAAGFTDAWRRYRDLRLDVALALSQLDCLAVAPAGDSLAERAAREARTILEREGATAYVAQLDQLLAERGAAATAPRDGQGRSVDARSDALAQG